ncbi:hypothetical protein D3C73_1142980 [compost metagenome]
MTRLKSAREEAIKESKIIIARNLLTMGLSSEQISKAVDLPILEVEEIKKAYCNNN